MKKIGLLVALGTNYGALLQSYATQQVVKKIGHESSVIIYKGKRQDILRFGLQGLLYYIISQFGKNKNKKPKQILDSLHLENKKKRVCEQQKFINSRFVNIKEFENYDKLTNYASTLDAIMIGSDQSWLPASMFSIKSSFSFVPKGVRRISYSTSLGVSKYPRYCWRQARSIWKKMDFLSVREEQGMNIIKQICGNISVKVVCDPTYLFTKSEWDDMIPRKCIEKDKYILCYFLGTDKLLYKIAQDFAKLKNLKLLSILTCEVATEGDDIFADRLITGASPEDFLNLIRGAEYILTDSFHGTAFSVINEKQFFLFYPQRDYLAQSRNSRLDNIVKMWGIEEILLNSKDLNWNFHINKFINYSEVTPRVISKRNESLDFLNKALHFND